MDIYRSMSFVIVFIFVVESFFCIVNWKLFVNGGVVFIIYVFILVLEMKINLLCMSLFFEFKMIVIFVSIVFGFFIV